MPDPVLLIHLSPFVRSSLNESFRALRATVFLLSSREVAGTNTTDAFMRCDNAGIFLTEFKLLDDADGQIKCFCSCPLSSRQERINLQFCLNAKTCAFTGPDKVLAVSPVYQICWEEFGTQWERRKPRSPAGRSEIK